MRITRTFVAALAGGVLVVGCGGTGGLGHAGGSSSGTSAGNAGEEVQGEDGEVDTEAFPVRIDAPVEELYEGSPTLKPRPAPHASDTDRVVHDLRERTLAMAGVAGTTTGSCGRGGIELKAGATSTCTVTYESLEIPWDVTVSEEYQPGDSAVRYRAKPLKGVLTAKGVGGRFYEQQSGRGVEEVWCSEIPDAELVELNTPTDHRCQYLLDSGGEKRWSIRVVEVRPSGVSFSLPED